MPTSGVRCWGGNDPSCNEIQCNGAYFSHFCDGDACSTYNYNTCTYDYCHPCPPVPLGDGSGHLSVPGRTPNRDGNGN